MVDNPGVTGGSSAEAAIGIQSKLSQLCSTYRSSIQIQVEGDHAGAPAAEQRLRRTPASHPAGRTLPGGGPNDLVRVG